MDSFTAGSEARKMADTNTGFGGTSVRGEAFKEAVQALP